MELQQWVLSKEEDEALADRAGGLEKVESDLSLVAETVASHQGLRQALVSPTVADTVKRSVLEKIFLGKVSDTVLRFLYVLVDKGREEYLTTILEVFRERLRSDRGEVEAHVRGRRPCRQAADDREQRLQPRRQGRARRDIIFRDAAERAVDIAEMRPVQDRGPARGESRLIGGVHVQVIDDGHDSFLLTCVVWWFGLLESG